MVDLRLGGFYPALGVPLEAAPAATLAFLYLLLAIYTLTFKHSTFILNTRILLCSASSYWFWRFGFTYDVPTRLVESGVAIICAYGIFRNVETGFAYLLEPVPRWVVNGETQKLPDTFLWRAIWSLDLLFSMRGTSYLPNTHWDFAPAALVAPKHRKTRLAFFQHKLVSLAGQFLLLDVIDTTVKARRWPTISETSYPITSLPLLEQLYFATAVCLTTALSISTPYNTLSILAVLFGCQPASWPSQFDHPFHAESLQAFWTHKWHASFRRIFLMVSAAIVDMSRVFIRNRRALSAFRGLCIFSLSCIMHLTLTYRIRPPGVRPDQIPFFDRETFLFFILQPIGMLVEVSFVRPFAKGFLGEKSRGVVWCTRTFAWAWLLWTGRYWSDVWVKHGLWAPSERVVGYSLVRGILYGQWMQ